MSGFILYWRDKYGVGDCVLSYGHKRTLLYLWLAAQADYEGENEGKLITSMTQLIGVTLETRNTTWRWMKRLEKDGLITTSYNNKDIKFLPCNDHATTMQRPCNKPILVTISNYREFKAVKRGGATTMQRPCNDHATNNSNSTTKTDSSTPLIKNKELINKKKEEEGVRKRTTASKKISRQQLQAMLKDEIIPFARSIGLDSTVVYEELDKWDDWVESKGKRFTDNRRAFKNWLRNAVKFRKDNNPGGGNRLEDIPLLTADDYD